MSVNFNTLGTNNIIESKQSSPIANHPITNVKDFAPTEKPQVKAEDYKNFAKKLINKFIDFIKNLSSKNTSKTKYADTLELHSSANTEKVSIEDAIKNAGFTQEGVENLIQKQKTFGDSIVQDSIEIAQKLNQIKDEIGYVSYNHLIKTIEDVRPDAIGSTKVVLSDVIMQGWNGGEEIQNDYYSQLPEPLAAEMKNLNKAIADYSRLSDEELVQKYNENAATKNNYKDLDDPRLKERVKIVKELAKRNYRLSAEDNTPIKYDNLTNRELFVELHYLFTTNGFENEADYNNRGGNIPAVGEIKEILKQRAEEFNATKQ